MLADSSGFGQPGAIGRLTVKCERGCAVEKIVFVSASIRGSVDFSVRIRVTQCCAGTIIIDGKRRSARLEDIAL